MATSSGLADRTCRIKADGSIVTSLPEPGRSRNNSNIEAV